MGIKPNAVLFERDPAGKSRWIKLHSYATGDIPAASSANEGCVLYDTTENQIKASNGSAWVNVTGEVPSGATASGKIMIGDGSAIQAVSMSGDATISAAGALTIATGAVEDSMIEGLAAGEIIVGTDGTAANNAKVTLSGAVTMDGTGATTLQSGVVNYSHINSEEQGAVARVVYNAGGGITAPKLVYIDGYDTGAGLETIAVANSDSGNLATHVVVSDINATSSGVVYPVALYTGVDTSLQAAGAPVYFDNAGAVSFSAPAGQNKMQQIVGRVAVVGVATGSIHFFPGDQVISKMPASGIQEDARNQLTFCTVTLPAPTGANQLNQDRFVFIAPKDCTITACEIISSVATSGSDATNRYTFELYNSTAANSLSSAVVATNGGAANELTAEEPKSVTVDQNAAISGGDVLVLRTNIEDDGGAGPTDLSTANIRVAIVYYI